MQNQTGAAYTLNIKRIVCGAYQANCYLVNLKGREDAFLVDAGDDYPLIEKSIECSGVALTDIMLTHGHFDHVLSAGRLAARFGARVHIHPFDEGMLKSAEAALYDPRASRQPFEPASADAPFEVTERCALSLCGVNMELIYAPGHSPGGMCFYCPENGVVFTGDTLFEDGFGRTDLAGGSVKQLRRSLKKLLSLPVSTIVHPGHGYSTLIERVIEGFA